MWRSGGCAARRSAGSAARRSAAARRPSASSRPLGTAPPPAPPAAPRDLALPDTLRAAVAAAGPALRQRGFAVVDGAFGETWCHLLRDDIITLTELQALDHNATHLVRADGSTELLAKHAIFETEPMEHAALEAACPWLLRLGRDGRLSAGLSDALSSGPLGRQTMKVQLNAGGGACFPYHFDSDRAVDSRVVTAILYLNPGWAQQDGGQLQLLPCPLAPVEVDPLFDRLVLFSSTDMLHRVLPSQTTRLCLTLWFYANGDDEDASGDDSPPASGQDDAPAMQALRLLLRPDFRHLFARYVYAREWALSIEQSHEPSQGRSHAVSTHWDDVAAIRLAALSRLEAAGLTEKAFDGACDLIPLTADESYVQYFHDVCD